MPVAFGKTRCERCAAAITRGDMKSAFVRVLGPIDRGNHGRKVAYQWISSISGQEALGNGDESFLKRAPER